jgi:hypothetical protein
MRSIIAGVGLAVLLFAVGCNIAPHRRDGGGGRVVTDDAVPSTEALVKYLNRNAELLKQGEALRCKELSIDCKADGKTFGLGGSMMCAKPRNFRLQAQLLGQPAVDIGSNDQEFWYWISKNEPPYLFHCSYDALRQGTRIPFPFQPDMVVAALGLAQYDQSNPKKYEVRVPPKANYYELIESAVSPQGEPIQKVTVFNRMEAQPPAPQVLAHVLKDARGNTICTARITSVQQNRETGAIYPRVVIFNWPGQKLQMTMELNNLQVVKIDQELAERAFTRKNLGYQTYDLATRTSDRPGNLQRTGATIMPQR